MHEARYYTVEDGGKIRCELCPHNCLLTAGQAGICRIREVSGEKLVATGYCQISSWHVDPIEKKPLYHFYPGSRIFSIGGWGCNFRCRFCQNWTISQTADFLSGRQVSPQDVVDEALRTGGIGVAYTYNEPLISWEFVYDCAVLVREAGLKNVLVTNGFINRKPAAELLKLIDALNIDIKSMDNEFYVQQCGGRLQPVLDFAVQAKESGAHVEITNLLIPGLNSGDDQIALLAGWVAEHLGKNTPLHISAYFPRFEMKIPATGAALVQHACGLALRFLDNVYAGNI